MKGFQSETTKLLMEKIQQRVLGNDEKTSTVYTKEIGAR